MCMNNVFISDVVFANFMADFSAYCCFEIVFSITFSAWQLSFVLWQTESLLFAVVLGAASSDATARHDRNSDTKFPLPASSGFSSVVITCDA